jgi:hypothetical protein
MQEIRKDGTEKITKNVKQEQIFEALKNPENKTIIIHKEGSVMKTVEGKEFTLGKDGKFHKHPAIK